jgi:hypothetical protein
VIGDCLALRDLQRPRLLPAGGAAENVQ